MKIIKRDGSEQTFTKTNIYEAISKANQKVKLEDRFTNNEIKDIAKAIEEDLKFYAGHTKLKFLKKTLQPE